jgi:hypothetical protein
MGEPYGYQKDKIKELRRGYYGDRAITDGR